VITRIKFPLGNFASERICREAEWRFSSERDTIMPMRPSGSSPSPSHRNVSRSSNLSDSWEPEPLELPLVLPSGSRAPGGRDTDHDDERPEDDDDAPARSGVIVIDLV
jgi:hypothetical protein